MIGVLIRAGVTCPSCESLVPVGALVKKLRCSVCGEAVGLDGDDWRAILGDVLEQAPSMEEGEASRSSILGEHRISVTKGRATPRYCGTDTAVPPGLVTGLSGMTELPSPQGPGSPTVARPVPKAFRGLLPGVVAVIGEDPALLAGAGAGRPLELDESRGGPVAFSCPTCGGQMIADGNRREAVCRHCGGAAAIPKMLWLRIHPSLRNRDWYLALDAKAPSLTWGGDALDAAPDGSGGAVLAVIEDEGAPMLIRLHHPGGAKWSRRLFEHPPSELGNPRLAWSPRGAILAWRSDHPDLHLLSASDGADLGVVRGADPAGGSDWERFTMLGCAGLAAFRDSMVVCSGPWRDGEGRKQFRLLRFSWEGKAMALWPEEGRGFLSALLAGRPKLELFAKCGNRPVAFRGGVRLAAAPEGGLLMLRRNMLASFDSRGRKLFSVELPDGYTTADPVADAAGRCWTLIHGAEHSVALVSVSPDGTEVEQAAHTDDSDHPLYFASALAPVDGGILTAGWNGGLYLHEVSGTTD